MIIVMKKDADESAKDEVKQILKDDGLIVREMLENGQAVFAAVGSISKEKSFFEQLKGVDSVVRITAPYKLVSRQVHPEDSLVNVNGVSIGSEKIAVVAGPCAVESREQVMAVAREVKRYGGVLFRGGAFKPRTSPYSFQGLEEEGLKLLAQVREEYGLGVVTEITSITQADLMMKYIDMVQIGARNMQNFELLKCVGRMGKPVLLKRGLSSTIEEWLMSAEYILSEGNNNVVLCERGIRTFEPYTRNTLDLSAIPVIKNLTHLPVVIDPSHATGMREKVIPMARAATAAGADGLMIEVHNDPDNALSDGPQSLYPRQFGQLMRDIYVIAPLVGKQVDFEYLDKEKSRSKKMDDGVTSEESAAFLGEPGTFSHKALIQYFGESVVPKSMVSFKSIFKAVYGGEASCGIVPIENSLSGSIHEIYDLLIANDLKITGEITIRILHNLVANPGTQVSNIKKIFAPPQISAQCRLFLNSHESWQLVAVKDSASAVAELKKPENKDNAAAIASKEAAEMFGMEVLEEGIESNPRNFTRFVVVQKEFNRADSPKSKSSMVYSVGNKPGSLFQIMKIFADHNVNLVKLESRPIHGKPWEYLFYIDLEADATSEEFKPVLEKLQEMTDQLRILGAY